MKQRLFINCFFMGFSMLSITANHQQQGNRPQQQVQTTQQQVQQPIQIVVQQQPQEFDSTPLVLQNFGGMISSFLNILVDPDNPEHVVHCVADMAQGMVNIFTVGMRRSHAEQKLLYSEIYETLLAYFKTEEGREYLENWKITMVQRTRSFNNA